MGNPAVHLHSFIVSNTPSHVMTKQWGVKKAEMEQNNILFQEEDSDTYIQSLFKATES